MQRVDGPPAEPDTDMFPINTPYKILDQLDSMR